MISAKHPDVFGYAGGQQTDLGSYPRTYDVWARHVDRIRQAGGIAYNINTNQRDGCNSYSNRGRLYHLVQAMESAGFPVTVNVFESCPHGYCAYRYPNGHQALYWFSQQFKSNARALGINRNAGSSSAAGGNVAEDQQSGRTLAGSAVARGGSAMLPGFW
jgi:hypothetical protein